MGSALSITNSTDDTITYAYMKKGENIVKTVKPGETEKEGNLSVGKEIDVVVTSENPNLEDIRHKIHAAYDASVTRKWKVIVEDGKLVVKRHGMDLGS